MLNIEEIELSQIDRIKPLWEKLNEVHHRDTVYFKDHYSTYTFENRMENIIRKEAGDVKISIITDDGHGRGYCLSTVDGKNGEIDSLYVDEDLRGTGLGKKMVEEHIIWLKEKGCQRIRLGVAYGNEKVMGFYHRMGFFERLTILEYKETTKPQ